MRSKKPFSAGKSAFAIFMALLLASAMVPTQAQARKFKVLHTFHGPNGYGPGGVLVRDGAGNLYGTTEAGGTGKCGSSGCGTAFKLNKYGKQIWLHSFNGASGRGPSGGPAARCGRKLLRNGYRRRQEHQGLWRYSVWRMWGRV
jgi:uncharacterized repeat protein (TIGR03803 family)